MAAPDMAAARRAADDLVSAGVGRVLLYGSVARGSAGERSDIDLVAIYDDLGDYSDRTRRRCDLESGAAAAAAWPVDAMVTDAPEWAVRTTRVPCSMEARVAAYAVELADGEHRPSRGHALRGGDGRRPGGHRMRRQGHAHRVARRGA